MIELPSRGWGPWRQEWYSIHSDPARQMDAGSWKNVWIGAVSALVYARWPDFWRWWVNLPPMRRRWLKDLQRHFPNLR